MKEPRLKNVRNSRTNELLTGACIDSVYQNGAENEAQRIIKGSVLNDTFRRCRSPIGHHLPAEEISCCIHDICLTRKLNKIYGMLTKMEEFSTEKMPKNLHMRKECNILRFLAWTPNK